MTPLVELQLEDMKKKILKQSLKRTLRGLKTQRLIALTEFYFCSDKKDYYKSKCSEFYKEHTANRENKIFLEFLDGFRVYKNRCSNAVVELELIKAKMKVIDMLINNLTNKKEFCL